MLVLRLATHYRKGMRIKCRVGLSGLLLATFSLLLSGCVNIPSTELDSGQLASFQSGFNSGWSDACETIFYSSIGNGVLYYGNQPITVSDCITNVGIPNPSTAFFTVNSSSNYEELERSGWAQGRSMAFSFVFSGGRGLCYGKDCVHEDDFYDPPQ